MTITGSQGMDIDVATSGDMTGSIYTGGLFGQLDSRGDRVQLDDHNTGHMLCLAAPSDGNNCTGNGLPLGLKPNIQGDFTGSFYLGGFAGSLRVAGDLDVAQNAPVKLKLGALSLMPVSVGGSIITGDFTAADNFTAAGNTGHAAVLAGGFAGLMDVAGNVDLGSQRDPGDDSVNNNVYVEMERLSVQSNLTKPSSNSDIRGFFYTGGLVGLLQSGGAGGVEILATDVETSASADGIELNIQGPEDLVGSFYVGGLAGSLVSSGPLYIGGCTSGGSYTTSRCTDNSRLPVNVITQSVRLNLNAKIT